MSAARAPRRRVLAAVLALWLGWLGAHNLYLGRRFAWWPAAASVILLGWAALSPAAWHDHPAFFAWMALVCFTSAEAVVFCVRDRTPFDARYNGGVPHPRDGGWPLIVVAVISFVVSGLMGLFGLAFTVLYVYRTMGWLDGLVL